jgi:transcription antitermination protein NusB
VDVLYQADITDASPADVLTGWEEAGKDIPAFASELVRGVEDHGPEIDLLLEEHAEGWTVSRMAALDRTIMRVAVEELLHRSDVPPSVAISEAVEMTSELSTQDARRFVNGILGRIAEEVAPPNGGPSGEGSAGG